MDPALCFHGGLFIPFRVFLAEQFEFLQPHLDAVMPAVKKPFLQQFYSQVRDTLGCHFSCEHIILGFFTNDQSPNSRRMIRMCLFTHEFLY